MIRIWIIIASQSERGEVGLFGNRAALVLPITVGIIFSDVGSRKTRPFVMTRHPYSRLLEVVKYQSFIKLSI